MPLAPKGRFLDVGPVPTHPEAVWIPASELKGRLGELPPKSEVVLVPDVGDRSARAVEFLTSNGWEVTILPPVEGPSGDFRLWDVNPFLEAVAPQIPPGRAVDLGCGTGRDSVYLASLGWDVVGVDRLPECIARSQDLERRYAPSEARAIEWRVGDAFELTERFDLVLCAFFWTPEMPTLIERLCEGGSHVVIEAFLEEHRVRFGKPSAEATVLPGGQLSTLVKMSVRRYEEGSLRGRATARLWASC